MIPGLQTQGAAEFVGSAEVVAAGDQSRRLAILPIAAALGALWFVVCHYLSAEWSFNEQYNYGWFVPFFAVYLFWLRWEDRPQPKLESRKSKVEIAVIALITVAAVILLPLRVFEIGSADWRPLGWVHVAAAETITLSIIYLIGGKTWLRHFSFPVLFFFVAVPWITPIEEPIVQGLMRLIAASAAEVLALFGIPAEVQGNLISLPHGLVGVNEACSGVRSLQTSLTIGLLFGELKRLRLGPRLVLVASAIGIALVANLLRATFLVWIASVRNLAAVSQWHDVAGYAIVVLVFLGTMFLATRFKTGVANPKSGPSRTGTFRNPKSQVGQLRVTPVLAALLLAWVVLCEIGAEFWYRAHERNLVARAGWTVQWPDKVPGYREIKIDNEVRNILRFDTGREAMWTSSAKGSSPASLTYLFFLRWNPGSGTILRARAHRPDICLPAAGWKQIGSDRIRNFEITPGRTVPFHRFEFVKNNGQLVHATAFFTLHEDVAHEGETGADAGAGLPTNWDWADRWRVVRDGIRNRGQQVFEVILITPVQVNESVADEQFAQLLPSLVEAK